MDSTIEQDWRAQPVPEQPSLEQLEEWMSESGCETPDGCWVEPDGTCEHDKYLDRNGQCGLCGFSRKTQMEILPSGEVRVNPGFPCGITPEVNLIGEDGNAFSILGHCQRAARKAGVPQEEIKRFLDEAMGGNYDHLLQTAMRYFVVN